MMTQPIQDSPALLAALAYARRSWPVAPAHHITRRGVCSCGGPTPHRQCSPGKHPMTKSGLNDATLDEAQIREWWTKWPDANILVRTGMVGDRCLVVLDIDPKNDGDEGLRMLEARHGVLPITPRTVTGSQGQHFWFWSSTPIRNTASVIAHGVDTRGVGGYVIVPPSNHESGRTYEWDAGADPDETPLAEAPSWLVSLVGKRAPVEAGPVAHAFIEGGRNNALASLAGVMRRKGFERESIEAALMSENERKCRPPLDPRDVKRIALSVARYEPTETPEGTVVPRKSLRFEDVVAMWKAEGPVVRVPTGWPTFDEAARGGLTFGRRTFLVGAPNAGKTAVATVLAQRMWQAGHVVGILAVDEEPDDITARFAQMVGFDLEDTESGDAEKLAAIGDALKETGVYLYDHGWSVEAAAEDLAAHARETGKRAVFIVDSVQTVRCAEAMMVEGPNAPRMTVAANVRALKAVTSAHRLMLIATSEMSRGGYSNAEAAKNFNDMAAGKESGDIEYAAAVQIVVRSVKDTPDKIQVNVPKLKRGKTVEFFLRLNRARHSLTECDAPVGESTDDVRTARARRRVAEDARAVREIILKNPGISVRQLRSTALVDGLGKDRVDAAITYLGDEVARRDAARGKHELYIQIPSVADRG